MGGLIVYYHSLMSNFRFIYPKMIKKIPPLLTLFFICTAAFFSHGEEPTFPVIKQLSIYVPGAVGGGYDHTAKVLRSVLLKENLVEKVEIVHLIGAGGVLALTYFINNDFQDQNAVLLGGRSMMGAALYNNSQMSILQTTPIARLNGKPLAIAVAKDSPIASIDDLFAGMHTDISLIKWLGGSAGAADSIFLKDLLNKMNIATDDINYHPVPGGGNAVAEQLVSGHYTAAISTLDEFLDYLADDKIRIIAVTSKERVNHIAAPTLIEKNIPLTLFDWHGVFAPEKAKDLTKQKLTELFQRVANNNIWQESLKTKQWQNNFLLAQAFVDFVKAEQAQLSKKFHPSASSKVTKLSANEKIESLLNKPYRWAVYIALVCLLLLITLFILKRKSINREVILQSNLEKVEQENQLNKAKLAEKINGISQHIEQEFTKWQLTTTEKEIALMLLKGLTFKEIAEVRCKSERTVRQQAGAIYAKSSLSNRSDLAAYFLEDFMTP